MEELRIRQLSLGASLAQIGLGVSEMWSDPRSYSSPGLIYIRQIGATIWPDRPLFAWGAMMAMAGTILLAAEVFSQVHRSLLLAKLISLALFTAWSVVALFTWASADDRAGLTLNGFWLYSGYAIKLGIDVYLDDSKDRAPPGSASDHGSTGS